MKTDKQVADNLREACKTVNTLMAEIEKRGYKSYFIVNRLQTTITLRAPYKSTVETL